MEIGVEEETNVHKTPIDFQFNQTLRIHRRKLTAIRLSIFEMVVLEMAANHKIEKTVAICGRPWIRNGCSL
jgi:hypothetical protein